MIQDNLPTHNQYTGQTLCFAIDLHMKNYVILLVSAPADTRLVSVHTRMTVCRSQLWLA